MPTKRRNAQKQVKMNQTRLSTFEKENGIKKQKHQLSQ